MPVRFTQSPPPQIPDNDPLRVYLDEQFRRVAHSQEEEELQGFALLYGNADDVVANDTSETPIVNYADSFAIGVIGVDPLLGTMTLPGKAGLIAISAWITLNQVTNTRNFTVQLMIEVDGIWGLLGSAYIPQNAQDVDVGISASLTRSVTGGEVVRFGLLLDGASPATFQVIASSFEIKYLTVRG